VCTVKLNVNLLAAKGYAIISFVLILSIPLYPQRAEEQGVCTVWLPVNYLAAKVYAIIRFVLTLSITLYPLCEDEQEV
jgi:hypothetical protein